MKVHSCTTRGLWKVKHFKENRKDSELKSESSWFARNDGFYLLVNFSHTLLYFFSCFEKELPIRSSTERNWGNFSELYICYKWNSAVMRLRFSGVCSLACWPIWFRYYLTLLHFSFFFQCSLHLNSVVCFLDEPHFIEAMSILIPELIIVQTIQHKWEGGT